MDHAQQNVLNPLRAIRQAQRNRVLHAFRVGRLTTLVATDTAPEYDADGAPAASGR